MQISKKNWATIIGGLIALGGVVVGAEIWINGADNYQSSGRRGSAMEMIFAWLGGLIGDKPLAILIGVIMGSIGLGLHKLGRKLPD